MASPSRRAWIGDSRTRIGGYSAVGHRWASILAEENSSQPNAKMALNAVDGDWRQKCFSCDEARMNSKGIHMARLVAVALLALTSTARLFAVDGIPRWEQVLNEVLERAEQERRSMEAPSGDQPPDRVTCRILRHAIPAPIVGNSVRYFQGPGRRTIRHP
jgi:hypothetical protein